MAGPLDASDDTRPIASDDASDLPETLRNIKTRLNLAYAAIAAAAAAQATANAALKGRVTARDTARTGANDSTTDGPAANGTVGVSHGQAISTVTVAATAASDTFEIRGYATVACTSNDGGFVSLIDVDDNSVIAVSCFPKTSASTVVVVPIEGRVAATNTSNRSFRLRYGVVGTGTAYVNRTETYTGYPVTNTSCWLRAEAVSTI